jgi:peptidoglycan/xylan/chitin deacetylase (PgdA/CDA1 family)
MEWETEIKNNAKATVYRTKKIYALFFSALLMTLLFPYTVQKARDGLACSMAARGMPGDSHRGIPILMYHKINPSPMAGGFGLRVTPGKFERQMRYLKTSGFHTVSLADLAQHFNQGKPLPARPVVITFDDGYLDNYTYAFPILKNYNMTATIFVVADTIGGINSFDYNAGRQPLNRMAGWKELKAMARSGITIGSHTLTHPHLAEVDPESARREIAESRKKLERGLGRKVEVFCYSYGSYNYAIAGMVRESGYVAAVTTGQGLGRQEDDPFTLKRIRVRGDYTQEKFLYELTRYYREAAGNNPG